MPDTEKKNVGRETREQNFSCSANSTDGQFVLCTGPLTAPRWCLLPRRYLRTFEGYLPYILFLFRRRLLSIHLGLLLVVYIKHGVVMPNYRPRSRGLFTSVRVETRCRKVYGHFEFRNQTVIL